jgi:hypothetical protein
MRLGRLQSCTYSGRTTCNRSMATKIAALLCRHAAELNMQTVPSLNITYTEEKVR